MATGPKWEFAPWWKGIDFDNQFESSLWVIYLIDNIQKSIIKCYICNFRDHKRFWMGVRCSSKRSFICESNFIYPEVDIKKYDVGITIDNDARATVNIKVAFDELPSDEDSKDVPLTLVVPKQASKLIDFGRLLWFPILKILSSDNKIQHANGQLDISCRNNWLWQLWAKLFKFNTNGAVDNQIMALKSNNRHQLSSFDGESNFQNSYSPEGFLGLKTS